MLLVTGGILLVAAAAVGAVVGPALGAQNGGDWAVLLLTLATGIAGVVLGTYLVRRSERD